MSHTKVTLKVAEKEECGNKQGEMLGIQLKFGVDQHLAPIMP